MNLTYTCFIKIKQNCATKKLPFDILRHVFLLAVTRSFPSSDRQGVTIPDSLEGRYKYVFGPSLSKEPLSFTYVCSWWRIVALHVPELWMALSGTPDWTLGINYGVLRVWMNNMEVSRVSRQACPLNLHLANISPMAPHAYETPRMGRVLQLFWEHVGIVRSLRLCLDTSLLHALSELLQQPKGAGSGLATTLMDISFTFASSIRRSVDEINGLIAWLGTLPALRQLRWIYHPSSLALQSIDMNKLPWETLENVTIEMPMALADIVTYVSRCRSAKAISLTTVRWMVNDGDLPLVDMPIVTLPLLTSLSLFDMDTVNSLFDYLALPGLEVLYIQTFPDIRPAALRTINIRLMKFIVRSRYPLRELTLRHSGKSYDLLGFYAYTRTAIQKLLDRR